MRLRRFDWSARQPGSRIVTRQSRPKVDTVRARGSGRVPDSHRCKQGAAFTSGDEYQKVGQ